jgi:hypothetical protein
MTYPLKMAEGQGGMIGTDLFLAVSVDIPSAGEISFFYYDAYRHNL